MPFLTFVVPIIVPSLTINLKANSYLEKIGVLNQYENSLSNIDYEKGESSNIFYLNFEAPFKVKISNQLLLENVNEVMVNNLLRIIDVMPHTILNKFSNDAIYTSKLGTIIMEYENHKSIFSIEIGIKSIGYFSEINSTLVNYCDETLINSEESFINSVKELNKDLLTFFDEIEEEID